MAFGADLARYFEPWSFAQLNTFERILLLRGAESDLLARDTAQAMCTRGPKAHLVEFGGVGHAPTLIAEDQRDTVTGFLLRADTVSRE